MAFGRFFRGRDDERRSTTFQSVWAAGGDATPNRSWSGSVVTQETALQLSTVYACVRLYCDTLSTLPAGSYIRVGAQRKPFWPRPSWLDTPDVGVTWGEYVQMGMVSLLLDGNWFARVYRDDLGEPVALVVLDPTKVEVRRNAVGRQVEYVWDGGTVISQRDMLHITELRLPGRLRGESMITQLRQTLGMAAALTEFSARFFGNGSITTGIIETPATLTREQATEAKEVFEEGHRGSAKSHKVGILGGGAKFVKTGVDLEQAQMLQTRAASVEDIARAFRVPPHKLGVTTPGAMSYASVEQNNIAWVTDSVRAYADKIESAHSRLMPGGAFLRLNLEGLLRGDTATRYSAYSTALTAGWAAINEVRRYEDMPPIEGGDVVRVPLANVDLPAANVVEQEKNVDMAVALINAGADPAQTLAAFDLPPIDFPTPEPDPVEPVEEPDVEEPDADEPTDDAAEDDTEETP